ncbi:MAG TPA: DUF6625 family protein [Chryseosolibacter sp.]|nr:DUF6625 family protein [Chryseosolibacter sp.]
MNPRPRNRTALVVCYFGTWPPWTRIFFHTCIMNPSVDFIFFTDCRNDIVPDARNLRIISFTLQEFNNLAGVKLQLPIRVNDPYKLCDFKPAYGKIFEDYLGDYDFWGCTDMDIVFGQINNFITDNMLAEFDVITAKFEYLVGHFTLYRNCELVNTLYRRSPDHGRVFTSNEKFCFDECSYLWFPLLAGHTIEDLPSSTYSMTHLVRSLVKQNVIRAHFETVVLEQDQVTVIDGKLYLVNFTEQLLWDRGRLIKTDSGKEVMYFHFHFLKNKESFIIPQWEENPGRFLVSQYGFEAWAD